MRKYIVSLVIVLMSLNCEAMDRDNSASFFIINPDDTSQLYTSNKRSNLLRRFMREAAVCCFTLTADAELGKVDTYYQDRQKGTNTRNKTKWSAKCPGNECTRMLQSETNEDMLKESLMQHWFATHFHQPALFEYASTLLGQSKAEAKRNFNENPIDPALEVIPFPELMDLNEEEDHVASDQAIIPVVAQPAPFASNYFILEPVPAAPNAFATFFAPSHEEVIALYIRSKLLSGPVPALEPVKTELVQRTKKQCLVQQGNQAKRLVCPEKGCMYLLTDASAEHALEKVTHAMLVHFLVTHKKDNPVCTGAALLVAPSFSQARDKIQKGEK